MLVGACLAAPLLALAEEHSRLASPDQNQANSQTKDQAVSTLKVNVNVV